MARALRLREPSALPGFGLAFGVMMTMLSIIVLVPIGALILRGADIGLDEIWRILNTRRVWNALTLSFMTSLYAALFNLVFGVALAWVLVRYRFWGRRILDATVDLPFALPTAVAGIALTAIYVPQGMLGQFLVPIGIQVAYTQLGIFVALVFVGLPFVVRTVQPVIQEIETEVEEVSATLGAGRLRTFAQVVLPSLLPAALTGFALALARAVGEYGSVIFIAGNLPNRTEIAPLLIVIRLEEFNYDGAVAIAISMLAISFAMLLVINLIQVWSRKRYG
ncbi:sulfate ABC transporter permease subunit CysT [Thioalkalicoccus limnaeus]|uniref:Sulfate transport system permease protein CysT n=1 Tax=Thioalkalicoccus limnaeus TaxID=120681 RepID=A0ABV4BBZ2_9GAMM